MTKPIAFNQPQVGGLRELAPLPGRARIPWWLAALLVLALMGGLWWFTRDEDPESLVQSRLVGPRSPAPVSVAILLDESGSFTDYDQVRRQVLDQLTEWAPENLRPDDLVTVVSFASDAAVKMPTTRVADLANRPPAYAPTAPGGGTDIQPALRLLTDGTEATKASVSLVAVTDTMIGDADPDAIGDLVHGLGATTMSVITPTGVEGDWRDAFGWELEINADAGSVDQTALAVGEAFAHATGQRLEAR
ncbi:VWA domain-containing protein [Nocardioides daphniae]|nr:VWA domain-containing protein [Nocardioides daphniae]